MSTYTSGHARNFSRLRRQLEDAAEISDAAHVSPHHVVALDPRSQGDSDKRSDHNYPERRAQDINELVNHLKLSPVVLVGWSLGVNELLTYAEQFGGSLVRAYVLVDGFTSDKQDPKFIVVILGLYRKLSRCL